MIVCGEPEDGDHLQRRTVHFGQVLPLPEPLAFDLDAAAFVRGTAAGGLRIAG
ncbi:hypothetical protein [Streptomyces sp. NPDC002133]|uniref:hypothetical protein n=1 Tax=Streptomyces sp. NPDC002133 TaxID=3154409 RepID=UPI00331DCB3C